MQFGEFLVSNGVVTAEQVVHALDVQRKLQMPLGRLALELGLINVDQVFELLNAQTERPEARFGELLIEFGMISEEQLPDLLEKQNSTRPPLGKVLVELGYLSGIELIKHLDSYHRSGRVMANA